LNLFPHPASGCEQVLFTSIYARIFGNLEGREAVWKKKKPLSQPATAVPALTTAVPKTRADARRLASRLNNFRPDRSRHFRSGYWQRKLRPQSPLLNFDL
jgi:hypothetical protein